MNRSKPPYDGNVVTQVSVPILPVPDEAAAVRVPPDNVPVQRVPDAGASQTLVFSLDTIAVWELTLTRDCELTLAVPDVIPEGVRQTGYLLVQDVKGVHKIVWPGNLSWRAGAPPAFAPVSGGQYLVTIITDDAGASFVASVT